MADLKESGGESALTVGTVMAATAGGTSLAAARLSVLTGRCFIREEKNDLSILLSPTRLTLSGRNGGLTGCLVGNTALLIAGVMLRLALSSLCGVEVIRDVFGIPIEDHKTGFITVSAWSLMLFALLYQGFSTCGVVLLFHADGVWEALLGLAALASVVVVPFIGLRMIRSVVDEIKAKHVIDPKKSCWTWLLGPGEWVSLRESSVERYGCLFQQYLPTAVFFFFVFECSLSLCFAFIEAVYVETWVQCGYKKVALLLVNAVYGLHLMRLMPHRLPFVNGLELVVFALACVGLGTAAVASFSEDPMHHWGSSSSDMSFMLAAYTVLLKCLFCIGVVLFEVRNKRRARLAGIQAVESHSKITAKPGGRKMQPLTVETETFSDDAADVREYEALDARDSLFTGKHSTPILWSPVSEGLPEPSSFARNSLPPSVWGHGTTPSPSPARNRSSTSSSAAGTFFVDSAFGQFAGYQTPTAGRLAAPGILLPPASRRGRPFGHSGNSPSSTKSNAAAESLFSPVFHSPLSQSASQQLLTRKTQPCQM
ncbi:hypothetical protein DIPPA_24715 [Diplonema papillatum]|nr:hypothetical protein DIPPA_24715 [Diplonema papillatum]